MLIICDILSLFCMLIKDCKFFQLISNTCLKTQESKNVQQGDIVGDGSDSSETPRIILEVPPSIIFTREPSNMENFQVKVENALEKGFSAWGRFCAKNRWFVVLLSFMFCAIFTAGNVRFKVVTDPVELWSAPNSRARLEKNYFDANFGYVYLWTLICCFINLFD